MNTRKKIACHLLHMTNSYSVYLYVHDTSTGCATSFPAWLRKTALETMLQDLRFEFFE